MLAMKDRVTTFRASDQNQYIVTAAMIPTHVQAFNLSHCGRLCLAVYIYDL